MLVIRPGAANTVHQRIVWISQRQHKRAMWSAAAMAARCANSSNGIVCQLQSELERVQGELSEEALAAWRAVADKWPISNLSQPFSFNPGAPPARPAPGSALPTGSDTGNADGSAATQQPGAEGCSGDTIAAVRPDTPSVPEDMRVAWGATEGGRDTLEWVRSLLRYTAAHPAFASSAKDKSIGSGCERLQGPKPWLQPHAVPRAKADLVTLQHWLLAALQHLPDAAAASVAAEVPHLHTLAAAPAETLPAKKGASHRSKSAGGRRSTSPAGRGGQRDAKGIASAVPGDSLASAALAVCGAAFDEFRRALAVESRDRAEVLAQLWHHFFGLLQLRASLQHEATVAQARAAAAALTAARRDAEAAVTAAQRSADERIDEHARNLSLKDAQAKNVAQRMVRAERAEAALAAELAAARDDGAAEAAARRVAEAKAAEAGAKALELLRTNGALRDRVEELQARVSTNAAACHVACLLWT